MRCTALVNPISGHRNAVDVWAPVAAGLEAQGVAVTTVVTSGAQHTHEAARRACEFGDLVVAVGGDGMVRDAANGVIDADGRLAIVAAGRGNDLARFLALPTEVDAIVDMLLGGATRRIDVLDVDGTAVPGNAYAGVDSFAARLINRWRRMPPIVLYRLAGAVALARWKPTEFTVTLDDETSVVEAQTVVIANSGTYGHGLRIVPSAVIDDGKLDVLIVSGVPKYRFPRFMAEAVTGRHIERSGVQVMRGSTVTIAANRSVPFGADGDEVAELPAKVSLRPDALELIVPAAS